jgi:hypothetical protein
MSFVVYLLFRVFGGVSRSIKRCTMFLIKQKEGYMKKTRQSQLISDIPNFRPVEFDGTRLDKKNKHCIIFKTYRDRNKAYSLLKKEGFDCKKN